MEQTNKKSWTQKREEGTYHSQSKTIKICAPLNFVWCSFHQSFPPFSLDFSQFSHFPALHTYSSHVCLCSKLTFCTMFKALISVIRFFPSQSPDFLLFFWLKLLAFFVNILWHLSICKTDQSAETAKCQLNFSTNGIWFMTLFSQIQLYS